MCQLSLQLVLLRVATDLKRKRKFICTRKMVISSFISSVLVIALGVWAYMKLEASMNIFAEKQLLIEPNKFSYKMWKDMPVSMYQSFTFFNLTNWNQVKAVGQKPRFVEVGPYVYRTIWTKSDVNFLDDEKLISFAEKKQWIFQPHLSKGSEDDQIWTINTPLMTALALIQNAPVITRNIVSVILDGLGEGAFIKRNIRSLLFEGYSDLIVSVGPLFDRRFSNFNGKFAYLYNKNDSIDGVWTVSTGTDDLSTLNKITKFQSSIVNMTSLSSGLLPQGLNEVKPECAAAWSLDQSTNGQLFTPFNRDLEHHKLEHQLQQLKAKAHLELSRSDPPSPIPSSPKRFFGRSSNNHEQVRSEPVQDFVAHPRATADTGAISRSSGAQNSQENQDNRPQLQDIGKYIFYPDLCRPIHLLPGKQEVTSANGIKASRYYIDPKVFMNSTQVAANRCYEMNPRPALANALVATINSVTGANVAMPNLVTGASSPFALFVPPNHHHNEPSSGAGGGGGLFERSNLPGSFLNNALHSLGANNQQDPHSSQSASSPISRLGRVRQLFSNIVSQRMSASPGSLLPSLTSGPAGMLIGNHHGSSTARNSPDEAFAAQTPHAASLARHPANAALLEGRNPAFATEGVHAGPHVSGTSQINAPPAGGSDRWITQFRLKWPRGVFSIGQCQLGAPIYASLPHFLDADEYYLEQVDGLKPNRSLHEFYIDIESSLHSIPVGAKARLQLNVATPELRFRNIPNAMIPVLWQEVTFEIDKPIATMLYWSFTMSSTIYKLVSLLLLAIGFVTLGISIVGCSKKHRRPGSKASEADPIRTPSSACSEAGSDSQVRHEEGQRSSWRVHPCQLGANNESRGSIGAGGPLSRRGLHIGSSHGCVSNNSNRHSMAAGNAAFTSDVLDEIRHRAALNHAFSSCTEFNDRLSDNGRAGNPTSGPSSSNTTIDGGSPKQPSSRASSHCELVSGLGNAVNCSGCLLACLRHSPNNSNHVHDHVAAPSDNSLVRLQVNASDIDKATLSSRDSNLDSCNSFYGQHHRTFKGQR